MGHQRKLLDVFYRNSDWVKNTHRDLGVPNHKENAPRSERDWNDDPIIVNSTGYHLISIDEEEKPNEKNNNFSDDHSGNAIGENVPRNRV